MEKSNSHLALADMNEELAAIIQKYPISSFIEDSKVPAAEIRAKVVALQAAAAAANPSQTGEGTYVEKDRSIPVRDGSNITVRIHSPKTPPADGSPVFVVFHGGGWVIGDLDSEETICRVWTAMGGVAVNVDYRMAPEHKFPTPVYDAFDALKWTSKNYAELGVNPKKGFLVGGVSAGGNLTAVITHLYRDENLSPPITGQLLSIPSVCAESKFPEQYKEFCQSREQLRDGMVLNRAAMEFFESNYGADDASPLRSPLLFPSHENLPPAYFQICGADQLRDEALVYEKVLREDYGIKTRVDMFPGLPHGFWKMFRPANFSKDHQEKEKKGLKWLLEQSSGK